MDAVFRHGVALLSDERGNCHSTIALAVAPSSFWDQCARIARTKMDDRDETVGSVANPPLPRSLRGVLRRITTANLLAYLHALTRPSAAARRRWGSRGTEEL